MSTKALHSKPKVFFTSSPNSGSLACEVVTFRYRSISLVKRSAYAAREVSASGGLMCFCLLRFAYTAASRLVFWSPKNGGTKTQVFSSRFCATKALHSKPKVFFTSSPNSRRLTCEDVSFRYRSISLVKRSACASREVFSLREY